MMVSWKGKVKVFSHDNIVFDVPSRLFTKQEVEQCENEILAEVKEGQSWVLMCIPDENAGLTPDALIALEKKFVQLFEFGCLGILILNQTASAAIINQHIKRFNIPRCVADRSIGKLFSLAEEWLEQAK
ncbi:hypothetical protein [Alteromonas flava]|uniref:hypothetical protein n=1 Tax=Alteromonas flava TaxID=2048003 RepID=UPI000C284FE1|nr:hypothetical protein [Alteromonas flava]